MAIVSWLEDLWNGGKRQAQNAYNGANRLFQEHLGPQPEAPTPGTQMQSGLSSLPRDVNGNPIPLQRDQLPNFIRQRWLASMNAGVDPAVAASANAQGASANTYRAGSQLAGVNTDFYGVPVHLPEGMTPEQLLAQIRDNPNGIGRGGSGQDDFSRQVNFPAAGPGGRRQGDMIDLDVLGPDNGGIIYNDTDVSDGEVSVNTVVNQSAGVHPVSGQRTWGFVPYGKNGDYMIYTTGSDSHNNVGTDMVGIGEQQQTWLAMMTAVQQQVRAQGGSAQDIMFDRARQDTSLMNRGPGALRLGDINQSGGLQSDDRGQQLLQRARNAVGGTSTGIDNAALQTLETIGDGAGVGSRYLGQGAQWLGDKTGLWSTDARNWQFNAGDIAETGEKAWNGVANTASRAWEGTKDLAGRAWEGAGNVANRAGSAISSAASSAWEGASNVANRAGSAVSGAASSAWNTVSDW